ncbi:DMT family transporter, partial [Eoetvoesiella caeni]
VLAYTTSVWVVPAAHLFFGERISKSQWIGALLGLMGVVAMLNPLDWRAQGMNMLYANMMLIGAAICWAICILHLRYSRAVSSAYHLAPWQMLVALVPLLIFSYVFVGPYSGDGSAELWLVLLYTGPLATAFCFCAVIAANRWMNSATISIAMLGVPVVGLLTSIVVLGEQLTLPLTLGVIAILAGILLICLPKTKKAPT